MDIISRLPDCAGQAAEEISPYNQVKLEDAPQLHKIPMLECQDIWIRPPRHYWPKSCENIEDTVFPLERNVYGHPLAGLLWERQFEKVLLESEREKVPHWECLFVHRKQQLFLSVYVDDIKNEWKEAEYGSHVEEIDEERWFSWTNIISWSRVFKGLLNVNADQMKLLLRSTKKCLNHVFLLGQLKIYQDGKNLAR